LSQWVTVTAPPATKTRPSDRSTSFHPELIKLAYGPTHVVTIADFNGARQHGVAFSTGEDGRAVHSLAEIGEPIESGRFSLPGAQTFPLAQPAQAHRVSEDRPPGRETRTADWLMRR
jgi:hypothetical protein